MSKIKQVIVVRTDLNMGRGKTAGQVAHAAMLFILNNYAKGKLPTYDQVMWMFVPEFDVCDAWDYGDMTKIVLAVPSLAALELVEASARHNGLTVHYVIDEKLATKTCIAIGPDLTEKIDPITKELPLLS